jgi:serine/threonine-protein kinase HipA
MRDLEVYLSGTRVGTLSQDEKGYLLFSYAAAYLNRPEARPLSHSLPLRSEVYEERECHPFFAGLLPDSEITRRALGDRFQVSKDDDFGLLSSLGRDCAGAVVLGEPAQISANRQPWLEPLDDQSLGQLIADLPHRPLFAEG